MGIALILPWITFQLPSALLRFLPGINDKKRWRDDFFSVLSFISVTTTLFSFCLDITQSAVTLFTLDPLCSACYIYRTADTA